MSDLFLSYSNTDRIFALRLGDALERAGREIWADWKDIRAGEHWVRGIQQGIAKANAFVLLLSPEAIASPEVQREIAWASEANKRMINILYRDVEWREVPASAGPIQWLPIADNTIEEGVRKLLACLDTDHEWESDQTRLYLRAMQWRDSGRTPDSTLRGNELNAAEAWSAAGRATTELIREYIVASRVIADMESARRLLIRSETLFRRRARDIAESALAATEAASLWPSHECDDILRARLRLLPRLAAELPQGLPVRRMAFSEDSTLLATEVAPVLGGDPSRRLWSIATGEQVEGDAGTLLEASPYRATFSSADDTLRVVEASTGEQILSLAGTEENGYQLTGDRLTVRMKDRGAVWSLAKRKCLAEAKGRVSVLALSADGTALAVAYGSSLQLRASATGETLRIIDHESTIRVIEFSGDRIAVGCDDGTCRVWIVDGTEVVRLVHNLPVERVAFDRSGDWIATFANVVFVIDDTVRVWDLRPYLTPLSSGWTQCDFDSPSTAVAIAGPRAARLDFNGGKPRAIVALQDVESAFYAADGFCVLAGERLFRRDAEARTDAWSIDNVTDVQGGETHCILTRADKSLEIVQIWDGRCTWAQPPLPIGDELAAKVIAMTGDASGMLAAHPYALSPDSRYLAVIVGPRILIVDAYTGELRREFAREKQAMHALVWSPRGRYVAAAFPTRFGLRIKTAFEKITSNTSQGKNSPGVFLLDVVTGSQIEFAPEEICEDLAFSPDESLLAAASVGGAINVWTVEGRHERWRLDHTGDAKSVRFSPDGRWLASGGTDGIARVWDLNTGQEAAWFRCRAEIRRVSFSGDGNLVYTFDASGEIWQWAIAGQSALLAEELRRRCRQELKPGVEGSFSLARPALAGELCMQGGLIEGTSAERTSIERRTCFLTGTPTRAAISFSDATPRWQFGDHGVRLRLCVVLKQASYC